MRFERWKGRTIMNKRDEDPPRLDACPVYVKVKKGSPPARIVDPARHRDFRAGNVREIATRPIRDAKPPSATRQRPTWFAECRYSAEMWVGSEFSGKVLGWIEFTETY